MDRELKKEQHYWHFVTASVYVLMLLVMVTVLVIGNKLPTSISVFDFFLLVLATFRVTRLLVHDLVLDFIRDFFKEAEGGFKKSMHDLLDCPWCTGAWVSLGIGFLYFLTPLFWPIILVFAVAGFGTILTILASMMMVSLRDK
jgi:hypothetical protein